MLHNKDIELAKSKSETKGHRRKIMGVQKRLDKLEFLAKETKLENIELR